MKLQRARFDGLTRWSWRWFSVRAVILLPLVLFLASIALAGFVGFIGSLIQWHLRPMGVGALIAAVFGVPGWSLGRGLPAELFNRTEVTFDGERVVVRHGPFAFNLREDVKSGEVALDGVEVFEAQSRFWDGGESAGWVYRIVGLGPGVEVVVIDGLLEGSIATQLAQELSAELAASPARPK